MEQNWNDYFTPQGWQCPHCKRCYSPSTAMCLYCGPSTFSISNTATVVFHREDEPTDEDIARLAQTIREKLGVVKLDEVKRDGDF